jgi:hypothetical protein
LIGLQVQIHNGRGFAGLKNNHIYKIGSLQLQKEQRVIENRKIKRFMLMNLLSHFEF